MHTARAAIQRWEASVAALHDLTPYGYVVKHWTEQPERFKIDPRRHMPGPNTSDVRVPLRPPRLRRCSLRAAGLILSGQMTPSTTALRQTVPPSEPSRATSSCPPAIMSCSSSGVI